MCRRPLIQTTSKSSLGTLRNNNSLERLYHQTHCHSSSAFHHETFQTHYSPLNLFISYPVFPGTGGYASRGFFLILHGKAWFCVLWSLGGQTGARSWTTHHDFALCLPPPPSFGLSISVTWFCPARLREDLPVLSPPAPPLSLGGYSLFFFGQGEALELCRVSTVLFFFDTIFYLIPSLFMEMM